MSTTPRRVQVTTELMEAMIARACDPERDPGERAPWPWRDGLSVMPERPVAYGNQEMHGVIATDGENDGERQVVVVLFNGGGQPAHRAFHYRADTATAHGSGGADGPVSEAQMDTDGRLVGEMLSLLAHGDGELIEQEHTPESNLIHNGESPPMLWRENPQGAVHTIARAALRDWKKDGHPDLMTKQYSYDGRPFAARVEIEEHEQEDGTMRTEGQVSIHHVERAGDDPNTDEVDWDSPLLVMSVEVPAES